MKPYCKATLNYSSGFVEQPVEVTIRDGRDALADIDYERCGFTLLEHRSDASDWASERHLQEVHAAEIELLAEEFLGADRAIAYTPLVRSPSAAKRQADYAPIHFVHSDYTDDYAEMVQSSERPYLAFLEPLLQRHGLSYRDIARAERIVMLQFWRNTGPILPDYPLAICDAQTVPRSQLWTFTVPEYAGQRLEFETFGVRAPESADANHWYTFPGLGIDEVIAFRTYDSRCAAQKRPFWTPHSAFHDLNAGADAAARESVEMRALCLFGL